MSSDDQAESMLGIEAQLAACRDYAQRNGIEVRGVFTDLAVKGSKGLADRPELLREPQRSVVVIASGRAKCD